MNFLSLILSITKNLIFGLKIKVFQKRFRTIKLFGSHPQLIKKQKLLFVITHIVPDANKLDETIRKEKSIRLQATLDGIKDSFAGNEIKIIMNTSKDLQVLDLLPKVYMDSIEIKYSVFSDPINAGFLTFDIFVENQLFADYFFFVEDDIIIQDTTFLDKIEFFNSCTSDKKWLLFPHRYEMIDGNKFFLDQEIFYNQKMETFAVNHLGGFQIGDYSFAEFENSHSGIFALSKDQLQIWIKTGYNWRNKNVAFGPLESAATFVLYECFRIFKPALDNMQFLQVKHWGTKYAERFKTN